MLMLLIAFQSTTISSKMADQPALLEAWSVADVASFLVLLANEAKLADFHRASARCTANAIDGKTLRQLDLSADDVHHDYGLILGTVFAWQIWGPLSFSTDVDLHYLVPDSDDRATDLSLLLASNHKLAVGVGSAVSVFGFADVYVVHGKLTPADHFGGSWIAGGGLEFRDTYRLDR